MWSTAPLFHRIRGCCDSCRVLRDKAHDVCCCCRPCRRRRCCCYCNSEHVHAPTVPKKKLPRCCMLRHASSRRWGGDPNFPKATKVAKPRTKLKGVHLPTPGKDEHNRITSWVVLMPSPIAQCKQFVVFLVVSLFLLACVVPSSVGSKVDIRRQSEENDDLSKHSTAKKKKKKSGCTVRPVPTSICADCHSQKLNQRPLNPDAPFNY